MTCTRNHQCSKVFSESDISIVSESFSSLEHLWQDNSNGLQWDCLFVLPPWIKAWWKIFGKGYKPGIYSCLYKNEISGIAPLMLRDNSAYLIGNEDTCDYGSLIFKPGIENEFISSLLLFLQQNGIRKLRLRNIPYDSLTMHVLSNSNNALIERFECIMSERIYRLDLPHTWEEYMNMLSKKDRHEIRRKMRRLNEAGKIQTRLISDKKDIDEYTSVFIKLFRSNIPEKREFMSNDMESFFRTLILETSEKGMIRILILLVNGEPAAATLCFDYHDDFYLYNNGYDRRFEDLSPGLMSKVFSIKEAILLGRSHFNFLKGDEPYKRYLGGRSSQLYNCSVILKQ